MPQVKRGSTVLVHYTAMLKNGEVIESTAGGEPLRVTVGAGKVMRGFEDALEGMGPGESRRVVIPPEKAYGRRKPGTVAHVSLEAAAPLGRRSEVLQHQTVNRGAPSEFCIVVTDKGLKVDGNPHLADQDLAFEIELVEIEDT